MDGKDEERACDGDERAEKTAFCRTSDVCEFGVGGGGIVGFANQIGLEDYGDQRHEREDGDSCGAGDKWICEGEKHGWSGEESEADCGGET